jgi:AmiR/NasT family two-component response regulator
LEGETFVIDAKLLASDTALDQAWRGGVGLAMAVTRAQELSDPLRLDVLLEDAKAIVSDRHACSPDEALARLCFVSWHTNRRLREIASEVVTSAANQQVGFADQSTPRLYRFTL